MEGYLLGIASIHGMVVKGYGKPVDYMYYVCVSPLDAINSRILYKASLACTIFVVPVKIMSLFQRTCY